MKSISKEELSNLINSNGILDNPDKFLIDTRNGKSIDITNYFSSKEYEEKENLLNSDELIIYQLEVYEIRLITLINDYFKNQITYFNQFKSAIECTGPL